MSRFGAYGRAAMLSGAIPRVVRAQERAGDSAARAFNQQLAGRQLSIEAARAAGESLQRTAAGERRLAEQLGQSQQAREKGYRDLLQTQLQQQGQTGRALLSADAAMDRQELSGAQQMERLGFESLQGAADMEVERIQKMQANNKQFTGQQSTHYQKARTNLLQANMAYSTGKISGEQLRQVYDENLPILQQLTPSEDVEPMTVEAYKQKNRLEYDPETGLLLSINDKGNAESRGYTGRVEMKQKMAQGAAELEAKMLGEGRGQDEAATAVEAYIRRYKSIMGWDEQEAAPEQQMPATAAAEEPAAELPEPVTSEEFFAGDPEASQAASLLEQVAAETGATSLSALAKERRAEVIQAFDLLGERLGIPTGRTAEDAIPMEFMDAREMKADMIVGRLYGPMRFPDGEHRVARWDGEKFVAFEGDAGERVQSLRQRTLAGAE